MSLLTVCLRLVTDLAMSESFGMPTEVMSWGNTLGTAANLHLMCSSTGSNYFEQAVPYEPYE